MCDMYTAFIAEAAHHYLLATRFMCTEPGQAVVHKLYDRGWMLLGPQRTPGDSFASNHPPRHCFSNKMSMT